MLCLVAGQRAGTTALQSALAGSGEFENLREIFQATGRAGSFINFLKQAAIGPEQLQEYEDIKGVVNGYYDFLLAEAKPRIPLIDVKYSAWGALNPAYHFPHEMPMFLRFLKSRNTSFIFITRRDLAAQIISEAIARQLNKWHDLVDADIHSNFELDLGKIEELARLNLLSENLLWNFFKGYTGNFLHASYEELFCRDSVCPDIVDWIDSKFALKLQRPVLSVIKKNRVDKRVVVANHDAATAIVRKVVAELGRDVYN